VIGAGCESEGIRPRFDRSNAGAPNGDAGAAGSGEAGTSGSSSGGEAGEPSSGSAGINGSSGSPANEGGAGGRLVPGEAGVSSGGAASGGAPSGGTPGVGAGEGGAAGTPDEGSAGGAAGAPPEPEPAFPCDVRVIIESACQRCHQEPQQNGAPFSLLTWSDTRAEYGIQLVYQAMDKAIADDFMPPTWLEVEPPVQPLTAGEKQILLDWLAAGAPPADVPQTCE
jgi:hypothetical protein